MNNIEKTLNKGISIQIARRTLGIGRKQLYTLQEQSYIINNRYEVVNVTKNFNRKLYSSNEVKLNILT